VTSVLLLICASLISCRQPQPSKDSSPPPEDTEVDTTNDTDDDTAAYSCTEDDECEAWEICEATACLAGDRNNSWDEAELLLWSIETHGYINPEDDVDYYTFHGSGGEWVEIASRPLGEDGYESSAYLDTIVTVYDPDGDVLAWEDDSAVGTLDDFDCLVMAYLAQEGTYGVEVRQASSTEPHCPAGGPDFGYEIEIYEDPYHTSEPDSLSEPSGSAEVLYQAWTSLGALLETEGDSDFYKLELPYDACPVEIVGTANLEGTDALPRIRMYDLQGNVLLDTTLEGSGDYARYPKVDGGEAVLEFLDADGRGSDNSWFWTFSTALRPDLTLEIGEGIDSSTQDEVEPNDDAATATVLDTTVLGTDEVGYLRWSQAWGWLANGEDEDWLAFWVPEDWHAGLRVQSGHYGSLLNAAISVYSPGGLLIESNADEVGGTTLFADLGELGEGYHTLRIQHPEESQDGGPGYFYFTGIAVSSSPIEW